MPKINIIGMGTGNENLLTNEARQAIEASTCLIGDKRILALFEALGKPVFYSSRIPEIMNYIDGADDDANISILVSGDVGFYSLAKPILDSFENTVNIRLICGIGSLQYFCAKLKIPWQDAVACSLHGRTGNIIGKVMKHKKVFVLTGGDCTPASVCRMLCRFGLGSVKVSVGENLSYDDERIVTATAGELADRSFASLSVMMIYSDAPLSGKCAAYGMPDEWFIRGNVPMTKQEVRAVSLSKLRLSEKDTVFDIGAGTGSVSVEIAMTVTEGFVYAVEKDEEAAELIRKNREKFGAYNLLIVCETAPDGLDGLPSPDKVFIGGSGGNLKAVLNAVYGKNPNAGVVINAVTLETLNEALDYYKNKKDYEMEITGVAVSKARTAGNYHLMTGQNPVFVIAAQKKRLD